jgi:hypothetical protein
VKKLLVSVLIFITTPAFAEEIPNPTQNQVIEIKMPDGSSQKGFIKDGEFITINPGVSPLKGNINASPPQIDITYISVPLNSRLKKSYTGYTVNVANASKTPVEIMNGDVINGVNGQGAALGAQKSSAAAIGTTLGTGLVTGIFTFGISTAASLIASPFIYGANSHKNNRAIAEGSQYGNQVTYGVLNPGDSLKINTLVPVSQKPQVKLSFKNIETGEIFTISK